MTSPETSDAAAETKSGARSIVVSRADFDAVPNRRVRYIVLYLIVVATWGVTTAGQMIALSRMSNEAESTAETFEAPESEAQETEPAAESSASSFRLPPSVVPMRVALALYALRAVLLVFFAIEFVAVLKTMGYPGIVVAGICIFVVLVPMPGLLAVAFIDRRVSKSWNEANDRLAAAA